MFVSSILVHAVLSRPEAQAAVAVAMAATCWAFLLTEQEAGHLDEEACRGQARHFAVCVHFSRLPVWRRRGVWWHAFVHVHIIAPTGQDCEDVFMELIDTLLLAGHLQFEHVPRPKESKVGLDRLEVGPTTIEVRPDALVEFDFNPQTAGGSRGDDCGEVVELVLAGTEELEGAPEVGPSAGEDTALVHAKRVGTREVVELVDPYVYSRHHADASWVAVFFTKYTIGGGQTPPVEHRCHAHISICKCKISKEKLDQGVARAKHVVERLLGKKSRHWQGQAFFDLECSGNGAEHYSWADILVQSPLHQTCFAIMHAISPNWPRVNFHMSFDSRPRTTGEVRPMPGDTDEVRPIAPAEPSRAGSSTDDQLRGPVCPVS